MSLAFTLRAKNSSGHQLLFFEPQPDGEFSLTLCGTHDGKEIQIDFDNLTTDELKVLIDFMSRHLPEGKQS